MCDLYNNVGFINLLDAVFVQNCLCKDKVS